MANEQKYAPVQTSLLPPYEAPMHQPGYATPPALHQQGYATPPALHQQGYAPPPAMEMRPPTVTQQVIVTQQPGSQPDEQMLVVPLEGHREWSAGLCGCLGDIKTFAFVWFCPGCAIFDISSKVGESCWTTCFVCGPPLLLALRTRLRTLGGIKGSILNDWLAVTWCYWCSIMQMSHEVDAMGLK